MQLIDNSNNNKQFILSYVKYNKHNSISIFQILNISLVPLFHFIDMQVYGVLGHKRMLSKNGLA